MRERLSLPGFVNAHSHAFQRALRGSAGGGDFWAWREAMLDLARGQTPGHVRTSYEAVYREMLAAGWTAVGEFHYLGFDEALAAAEAAPRPRGSSSSSSTPPTARGGLDRFRQDSAAEYLREVERLAASGIAVGLAPHSVRACPRDWLEEVGRYAAGSGLVLHVHADEQPREIEECLAEHGLRPIELLAETGCLGPRTTVVHATHADDARAGACWPTPARASLRLPDHRGRASRDGFAPVERLVERGIGLCVGSDSNVRIDPLEELRELDGIARRRTSAATCSPASDLLCVGSDEGRPRSGSRSGPTSRSTSATARWPGSSQADIPAALVCGCAADVFVSPR